VEVLLEEDGISSAGGDSFVEGLREQRSCTDVEEHLESLEVVSSSSSASGDQVEVASLGASHAAFPFPETSQVASSHEASQAASRAVVLEDGPYLHHRNHYAIWAREAVLTTAVWQICAGLRSLRNSLPRHHNLDST